MANEILELTAMKEPKSLKVDKSYRVVIPSFIREKMELTQNSFVNYYTSYHNGKWYVVVEKNDDIDDSDSAQEK